MKLNACKKKIFLLLLLLLRVDSGVVKCLFLFLPSAHALHFHCR